MQALFFDPPKPENFVSVILEGSQRIGLVSSIDVTVLFQDTHTKQVFILDYEEIMSIKPYPPEPIPQP